MHLSFYSIYYVCSFFFFNDTATTEIYTLSLHDALPISHGKRLCEPDQRVVHCEVSMRDRKSTRLNSSHVEISYAVFCLKTKKQNYKLTAIPNSHNERLNRQKTGIER